jgi:hypothetical protein
VGTDGGGRLHVFLVAGNAQLLTRAETDGDAWSGWRSLGRSWPTAGAIAVAADGNGRLHVFLVGGNSVLYTAWQSAASGSWSGWLTLG